MKKVIVFMSLCFLMLQVLMPLPLQAAVSDVQPFNYADAFAKSILFYEANWCGSDAGSNRLKWRGPCHVNDGKDVGLDLTGGFHDAGDHVKFGLPQGYAASTLGWAYYEFKDTFIAKGQEAYMLNVLKHFNDYFIKCFSNNTTFYYQVGDGTTDHGYWGPPELQGTARPAIYAATPGSPASDVTGEAAASLALMYLNVKDKDPAYAEKCLNAAKGLYNLGYSYRGISKSGGFYEPGGYYDELMWGAVWLYIATNDNTYLSYIDTLMNQKGIGGDNLYENRWTHCWDDVYGGVFLKLAQVTSTPKYRTIVENNFSYWMNGITTTPGGLRYLNSWGVLRYSMAESMLALVYYKTSGKQEYLNLAKSQVDYALGNNPRKSSYVVGFGSNYPKFPHHRAASGRLEGPPADEKKQQPERHLLYGALVGGPDSGDNYIDDVERYVFTEVAIDYNAAFVGAMAGITKYFGSNQTPEAIPGIEANTPEIYMEAFVKSEDGQQITVDAYLHNESSLPPRYEKGLTFRYFVDLSEYYTKGLIVNSVTTRINYAPNNGKISELIPWDEAKHIYYVEASWPDTELYGKTEFQFAITAYNASCWSSTNDFSRTGLTGTAAVTEYIPVYRDGVKISGKEPPGSYLPPIPTPTKTPVQITPTPVEAITPIPTSMGDGLDFKVDTVFVPTKLVANQMITAKVTATDTSADSYAGTKDVLVILALYDSNNTMVNVSYISKGISYRGTETLSAGFKLPSNITGYSVRAFMWDGTDMKSSNMIPLSNVTRIS